MCVLVVHTCHIANVEVREQLSQIVLLFVLWNPEIEQIEHRLSGLAASVFTTESSHRY